MGCDNLIRGGSGAGVRKEENKVHARTMPCKLRIRVEDRNGDLN